MKISVGGLAKAREGALTRVNAHFNSVAAAHAHDDAVDLRRRLSGEIDTAWNPIDPVMAREAERQSIADRINAAASIDEIARLVKDWDANGIR